MLAVDPGPRAVAKSMVLLVVNGPNPETGDRALEHLLPQEKDIVASMYNEPPLPETPDGQQQSHGSSLARGRSDPARGAESPRPQTRRKTELRGQR